MFISETKSVMYETQFLKDIAMQNYYKYNVTKPFSNMLKGIMLSINSIQAIGVAVAQFYNKINLENVTHNSKPILYTPQWDDVSKGHLTYKC